MAPRFRKLRVFSQDPILATRLESAVINEIEVVVEWEVDHATGKSKVLPGPIGEYLEVIDHDAPSQEFIHPVDLNRQEILGENGLDPSVGDPQFHQQMVYAVAMSTIGHFERALGRTLFWSDYLPRDEDKNVVGDSQFVRRLRIYPHALREPNAYYSPAKKAILFGYFPAGASDPQKIVPDTTVFTCLSQDIIVHETTHALLDGLHPRFTEPTGIDMLAFHEAFADIVALLQHFSYPTVLRHVIGKTRGDLESQNQLGQLAQEFGYATGHRSSLRSALGSVDESGQWTRRKPDPTALDELTEPHDRGAILVAAVFDAFLAVYRNRIGDLLRIATSGSGVLPEGHLNPDLVNRMAVEAEDTARHLLHMCIRALDYCPPLDITFDDYLRALITADAEVNPGDPQHYRVAITESFRNHGISPRSVKIYSEANLRWPGPGRRPGAIAAAAARDSFVAPRVMFVSAGAKPTRKKAGVPTLSIDWDLHQDRLHAWRSMKKNAETLHLEWIPNFDHQWAEEHLGLILYYTNVQSVWSDENGIPKTEVHSVRIARRLGIRGDFITELVVEITQRRRGYVEPEKQTLVDNHQVDIFAYDAQGNKTSKELDEYKPDFRFRGGCTLLLDPDTGQIRYAIKKRSILDNELLDEQRRFLMPGDNNLGVTYTGEKTRFESDETFALLHR